MASPSKMVSMCYQRPALAEGTISFCRCVAALAMVTALFSGCVHRQLERNTALAATTVGNIQYRMVLDNIAMMSCDPANLPSHVRLADGTVQISNQASIGEPGGFTFLSGSNFGIERLGPAASTKVSEQWGTDAVEDPIQVFALQSIYRKAFGLQSLEEPNFITAGKKARNRKASSNSGSGDDREENKGSEQSDGNDNDSTNGGSSTPEELPSPSQDRTAARSGRGRSSDQERVSADLDASDFDIPVGWFAIGCKKDVPKNACYVGQFRDRYAWVMPGDVHNLAKFTLAVLTITKLESGEAGSKSGLMFTP